MGDQWHPTQEKYDKINLIKIDCELRGTWGGGGCYPLNSQDPPLRAKRKR